MARGRKAAAVEAEPVEGPWDLPDGWRWERLGMVSTEPLRGAPASRFNETFRYLDVSSIDGAEIAPKCLKSKEAPSRARQFVKAGDTVLSGVRVYLRNIAMVPDDQVDVASTAFCVLRPGSNLDARFMHRWISSDWFINALIPLQRGNSPPAVLDADVRDQPIPVPPLDVQRAISARVDALFAEIDEGEAALAEARAGVETYRKALLKAAVTGELTADWRATNPPQETGEQLLARILADRRARWHADPKNARKRYIEPAGPDTDGLPELPEGWTWASIEQLTIQIRNGLSTKPTEQVGGVPILRISAVRPLEIVPNQVRLLPPGSDVQGFQVCRGDLIATRYSGSPQFVGVVAKFRNTDPIAYPDKLIRLQMWTDDSGLTDFVEVAANCWQSRRFIEGNIKTTAGQHGIAGGSLAMAPVPIPPREEASEIMRRVRQAIGTMPADIGIHQLEDTASTLRQSILAAAFQGELAA